MGRYIGPSCRLCRREGMKLFIKGTKCFTGKCAMEKRAFPPGQHGQGRIKLSNYGIQLREKQKVKRIYGVLERQFRRYFRIAQKGSGVTGEALLEILECRLDNVLYRMTFASSRREGREMVVHRCISVNDHLVDIPSYVVKVGDVVQVLEQRKGLTVRAKDNIENCKDRQVPAWVQMDAKQLKGVIVHAPNKDDVGIPIQEQLIVELYSK